MSSALARLVNGHRSLANPAPLSAKQVSSGSILDYEVEKCLDDDNNQRCSTPFLVSKSTCYNLSWKTDGALSHTTIEVRDAGSNEIVYFRDTDGEWTPEKGEVSRSPLAEVAMFALVAGHRVSTWQILLSYADSPLQLVYVDFKPKVYKQGNKTVDYEITTCA